MGDVARALAVPALIGFGLLLYYFYPESLVAYVISLLIALLYTRKKFDERDIEISRRAGYVAYFLSTTAFMVAFLAIDFGVDFKLAVSVAYLFAVTCYWFVLAYYYRKMG